MKTTLITTTLLILLLSGCAERERTKQEQNLNLICENMNRGGILELNIVGDHIEVSGFTGNATAPNSSEFRVGSITYKLSETYNNEVIIYKYFNGYFNKLDCQKKDNK